MNFFDRKNVILAAMILLLLLTAILVTPKARGSYDITSRIIGSASSPFISFGQGISAQFETFGKLSKLQEENARLKDDNNQLRSEAALLKEVRNENQQLRKEAGFASKAEFNLIPAEVVSYQPDSIRQFISVNRGRRDGVKTGMAVVTNGVLVGRISEAGEYSSKVFLITDPSSKINVATQNGQASGILRGQIGFGLIMEKIAQSEKVALKDVVVTTGSDELPKGLVAGDVTSINNTATEVFQSAQIIPAADFRRLTFLFIIGDPK